MVIRSLSRAKVQTQPPKVGPVYKAIIEAIETCNPKPGGGEIFRLFRIIETIPIPDGHEAIMDAIDDFFTFEGKQKYSQEISQVMKSLRERRYIALKAEEAKQRKFRKRQQSRMKA